MLEQLKEEVFKANILLVKHGLVIFTWGNVSGFDPDTRLVVIKPSGVEYDAMTADDMVVVDLDNRVVEGELRPSSDTPTHTYLYRQFPQLRGVVHTHSTYAVAWAQACRPIPALGTTHADHFYGPIPCTRILTAEEVAEAYEHNTGKVIVETLADIDPVAVPGILVANHGPFAWGVTPEKAVYHAVVLEQVAKMAFLTVQLGNNQPIAPYILDKHYQRKHGKNAYYGQKK
ncbi:MAG: L-ribulose-5-phosphate 4-epimerase [Bacteroidales bacterium]